MQNYGATLSNEGVGVIAKAIIAITRTQIVSLSIINGSHSTIPAEEIDRILPYPQRWIK